MLAKAWSAFLWKYYKKSCIVSTYTPFVIREIHYFIRKIINMPYKKNNKICHINLIKYSFDWLWLSETVTVFLESAECSITETRIWIFRFGHFIHIFLFVIELPHFFGCCQKYIYKYIYFILIFPLVFSDLE